MLTPAALRLLVRRLGQGDPRKDSHPTARGVVLAVGNGCSIPVGAEVVFGAYAGHPVDDGALILDEKDVLAYEAKADAGFVSGGSAFVSNWVPAVEGRIEDVS